MQRQHECSRHRAHAFIGFVKRRIQISQSWLLLRFVGILLGKVVEYRPHISHGLKGAFDREAVARFPWKCHIAKPRLKLDSPVSFSHGSPSIQA
jgi:hypothetical protein